MVWVEEDNISIHSEKELKEQPGKCAVGSTCSVKFGRRSAARWYTGKIASVGKSIDLAWLDPSKTSFKHCLLKPFSVSLIVI